jgi:hypothetical protein
VSTHDAGVATGGATAVAVGAALGTAVAVGGMAVAGAVIDGVVAGAAPLWATPDGFCRLSTTSPVTREAIRAMATRMSLWRIDAGPPPSSTLWRLLSRMVQVQHV